MDNSCPFVVEQDINSGFCVYVGGECVDTSCPPIVGMYDTGCKAILWSMALAIRVSCAVYGTGKEGQLRGLCQRQMWVVWAVYVVYEVYACNQALGHTLSNSPKNCLLVCVRLLV